MLKILEVEKKYFKAFGFSGFVHKLAFVRSVNFEAILSKNK